MRQWRIQAFFPELKPAHLAHQEIVVERTTLRGALGLAMDEIKRRAGIKGKRITVAKFIVIELGGKKALAPATPQKVGRG